MLDFTVFDGTTHSATLQQQNLVIKKFVTEELYLMSLQKQRRIQTNDPLQHMLQELGFKLLSQAL